MKDLTKYEFARIIGARALQLSLGAPPVIKASTIDPIFIAQEEYEKDALPLYVLR